MVNPYFHMFGFKAGILASVAAGATMLPEAVFDVEHVLSAGSRRAGDRAAGSAHALPVAPRLRRPLRARPLQPAGGRDRRGGHPGRAGAPGREELPFSLVVTGYGLTEAGTATATSPQDDAETVATTVGRPRPGFELRVVDGKDREVSAGEPGEILLRGPSVMSHYLDDPTATAEALAPGGWLRTGDLGVVDATGACGSWEVQGHVHRRRVQRVPGRDRELPPAARRRGQVAVVGVPDGRLGEVGVAFVVPRRAPPSTAAELIEWSRAHMANYKAPRAVEFVGALPINATGKVHKAELREEAARLRPGATG